MTRELQIGGTYTAIKPQQDFLFFSVAAGGEEPEEEFILVFRVVADR